MELQKLLLKLGKNIKYHRVKQKYTQQDLAKIIGISVHTLRQIEKGKFNIMLYTLFRIQKELCLTNEELFKP